LPLHRLDDERRDVAARQLGFERREVPERHCVAARQKRPEALAELLVAVDRHGPKRQPVEATLAVDDARPAGRGAGELQRTLDRLGSRAAQDRGVQGLGRHPHEAARLAPPASVVTPS